MYNGFICRSTLHRCRITNVHQECNNGISLTFFFSLFLQTVHNYTTRPSLEEVGHATKHVASRDINVPEGTQIYCLYQVRYEAPETELNRDYDTNKLQLKDFLL